MENSENNKNEAVDTIESSEGSIQRSITNQTAMKIFSIVAILMSLYQITVVIYPVFSPIEHQDIHLFFALTLIYLWMLGTSKSKKDKALSIILIIGSIITTGYIFINFMRLTEKIGLITNMDTVIGVMLIIVVLEATRRTFGIPLPILVVVSIFYAKYGELFPGFFNHAGYDWPRLIASLTTSFTGIYGTVLDVSATFLCIFMIFGGMLEASGAGKFFIDLATALGGRTRSGPAQAAVISSGLVGSINGSAVANVVTTGVFTIPLMKKTGYPAHLAGAVEAVASTGGMIMPPVMGVGAFVMSGITGIPYSKIALAALVPALFYYFTCGASVHLFSIKNGFKPMDESMIPNLKKVLKEGAHFLLPLFAIVYYMTTGTSVMRSGFNGIITLIMVVLIRNSIKNPKYLFSKEFWLFIKDGLVSGAKSTMSVAAACAAMGLISQAVVVSGLAFKIVYLIKSLSGGYSLLAVLLTMVVSLFFGMGIPTTASYIIVAVIGAPALTELGFSLLATHLFIYYYAILANLTPPVASAALVASRIAEANYTKTALRAVRLGLPGFILPILFIYNPELILQGTAFDIATSVLSASIGMLALAACSEGYLFDVMNPLERIIMGIGSALMIIPGITTDLIGFTLFIILVVKQFYTRKKTSEL